MKTGNVNEKICHCNEKKISHLSENCAVQMYLRKRENAMLALHGMS
jgi:hypothetical protein